MKIKIFKRSSSYFCSIVRMQKKYCNLQIKCYCAINRAFVVFVMIKFFNVVASGVLLLISNVECSTDGTDYTGNSSPFLLSSEEYAFDYSTGEMEFKLLNGEVFRTPNVRHITDPTYDKIFRLLFTSDTKILGYSGNDRLKSLLNGILFPEADDNLNAVKIRKITPLDGEVTNLGKTNSRGVLRFDIVCTCHCWGISDDGKTETEKYTFDVEMQRAYEEAFDARLFNYGSGLYRKYGNPVKVVAFLNHILPDKGDSFWILPCRVSHVNKEVLGFIDNAVDIHSIDLRKVVRLIDSKKKIMVHEKEIGKVGREWLKLLGIRQWQHGSRFCVPTDYMTEEVKSAVEVLSNLDDLTLMKEENAQKSFENVIASAEKLGEEKATLNAWISFFAKTLGHQDPEEILGSRFSPVSADFVTEQWGNRDEEGLLLFLDLLNNKGLLE